MQSLKGTSYSVGVGHNELLKEHSSVVIIIILVRLLAKKCFQIYRHAKRDESS